MKAKTIVKIIASVGAAALLAAVIGLGAQLKKTNAERNRLAANQNAYIENLHSAKNDIHQYQLTLADMRALNDSVTNSMLELKDKLKIKDKQIKSLQHMASQFERKDTIRLTDTIFVEDFGVIDTTLGDRWFSTKLHLEYPSTIAVSPKAYSEKNVAIYYKKETIKPAKKCWLARLFQKKQKVVRVHIDEKNPYLIDQNNEFIEVVK